MKSLHCALIAAASFAMIASSCGSTKSVTYLSEAETLPTELLSESQNVADPIIMVGDLLNIEVTSPNMPAVAPFNRGRFVDSDGKIQNITRNFNSYNNTGLEVSTEYYLVNADGCIDFPVIGKIEVAGKTKSQVATDIADDIYPKYVTDKPSVDIRLMNFRVTVAGAVRNPGVYQSKNERMTFLEAITMAGDLDIKGDRETILLYRTNSDGTREAHRINIHDKDFLLSPYFTLQQNDYIYVEPNKSMRQNAWQMNPAVSATISVVGGMSSLASLVIGIVNLSK